MKIAIVYYSLYGNCALVAGALKEAFAAAPYKAAADLFEIPLADDKKRSGMAQTFWALAQMIWNKRPALKPLSLDMAAYDVIVLGTPVWGSSPVPAIRSFLHSHPVSGKKVALFCCHTGGKGKTMETFKALLGQNTVIGEIDLLKPVKNYGGGQEAALAPLKQQLADWVKDFAER